MAELNVRFDVRFNQSTCRWLLAALVVCLSAAEVGSESVTLNTYYPAPSGVYNYIITTRATYLARDGDMVTVGGSTPGTSLFNVGTNAGGKTGVTIGGTYVGTAAPTDGMIVKGQVGIGITTPGHQLHVNGAVSEDGIIVDAATYPEIRMQRSGAVKSYIGIAGNAGGYATGSTADSLVLRSESNYIHLAANGGAQMPLTVVGGAGALAGGVGVMTNAPVSALDVGGGDSILTVRQRIGAGGCWTITYGNGITPCVGGYATLVSGVYANEWALAAVVFQSVSGGQGTMLCCPWPSGIGAGYPF